TYGGVALHDRQHPHDLFMETAAIYRHAIAGVFGVELYAAASGEPALGPTAFMHRASAMNDPLPPIGHHWQDSTHISFGVFTAGPPRAPTAAALSPSPPCWDATSSPTNRATASSRKSTPTSTGATFHSPVSNTCRSSVTIWFCRAILRRGTTCFRSRLEPC